MSRIGRVLPVPERRACGGRVGLPPAHFRQRDVPVTSQQPAPIGQCRFDAHVVDGAFAPDQVEGTVGEVESAHVRHAGLQSVCDAQFMRLAAQRVDERGVVVDGDDARRRAVGQNQCLGAGPAADVEHAGPRPDVRHEPEGTTRARCCPRSLPGQPTEQLEEQRGRSIRRCGTQRHASVRILMERQERRVPAGPAVGVRCRRVRRTASLARRDRERGRDRLSRDAADPAVPLAAAVRADRLLRVGEARESHPHRLVQAARCAGGRRRAAARQATGQRGWWRPRAATTARAWRSPPAAPGLPPPW